MSTPMDIFEMSAQRESACPNCGERIREGSRITLAATGGDFLWVHATCPSARPACGTCFLEIPLNGVCPCQI